jgi:hypothetical protein
MKIPVEKTPVEPHDRTSGQVRPGRKNTQNSQAAPLFRPAAGKASAGQTAEASRTAGSRAVPVPEAFPERAAPGGTRAAGLSAPGQAGTDRLSSLLSALKLPNDSLSESIVSFSRYFSLQLEQASLGALRKEILVQKKREAAALGAAAAADKGLGLESRALEAYADAIDPAEWQEPERQDPGRGQQDPGQQKQGSGQQEPEQQETRQQGKHALAGNGRNRNVTGEPTAEELKRQVTAALGEAPDFINRIPGKNGRRWLVVPFSFSGDGFDLRASFRVLLPEPDGKGAGTGRFAADIAVFREKELSRRWFFLLEGISGGDFKAKRAEFSVSPPVSDTKALIRELAKAFALSDNKITLNKKGSFSDSRADLLRTVDEEV